MAAKNLGGLRKLLQKFVDLNDMMIPFAIEKKFDKFNSQNSIVQTQTVIELLNFVSTKLGERLQRDLDRDKTITVSYRYDTDQRVFPVPNDDAAKLKMLLDVFAPMKKFVVDMSFFEAKHNYLFAERGIKMSDPEAFKKELHSIFDEIEVLKEKLEADGFVIEYELES